VAAAVAVVLLAGGLGLAIGLAARARAADPSAADTGRQLYAQYCASCHGLDARGHGPVAPELKRPPSDLTRLAARYGTPLPVDRLAEFIDGRAPVAAHGPREMPVWGKELYAGERAISPAREAARQGTIHLILAYLATIQAPAGAPASR
jgi:mono/diheme cytochrome c family protein